MCKQLHARRERVARILDEQIGIAKRLSNANSIHTIEVKHAWEIVEELSQKLDKLTTRLDNCLCEEQAYYAKQDIDVRLSQREYEY